MKKITLSTLAILVMTASAFTLRNENATRAGMNSSNLASNGAFRDGLFLGKRTGENGNQYRAAVGRWSTTEDRTSFAAGYDQGYKTRAVLRAAK